MAAKSAFTTAKTLICSPFPSHTHTHCLSLSISFFLLSFCHNKQSAICCVCCASAAFKCSNHKMSLEQLYSYFAALSYNAPVSLSSSLPVSFSLLHFPSLSCFADCFRRSVCLFVFGVQKKFPNMRLKLNVKMCRACACVCLFVWVWVVYVCVCHIYLLVVSGNKVRTIYTTCAPHPSEIKCCAKWRWQKGSSAVLFFHLILLMCVPASLYLCVCVLCRGCAL